MRLEEKITFSIAEHLVEVEVMAADILHIVFFESPLDHLRRVILTGQLESKHTQPDVKIQPTSRTLNVTVDYSVAFFF